MGIRLHFLHMRKGENQEKGKRGIGGPCFFSRKIKRESIPDLGLSEKKKEGKRDLDEKKERPL